MSDLALVVTTDTENPIEGDLRLVDGQLVLVEGRDAIRQDLSVRLRWFRGEWFLDRRTGLPWFERILGHRVALAIVERILRRTILSTAGITSITRFELRRDAVDRTLALDFEVRTVADDEPLEFRDFLLPVDDAEVL